MIIFCFSVPIMMIIMGSMTALTGGVTTPLLLFSVIGFILFFIFISLLVFQKKESTSTTNEIITKKVDNIYWLYLCVLFHYSYLILTNLIFCRSMSLMSLLLKTSCMKIVKISRRNFLKNSSTLDYLSKRYRKI